MLYGCPKVIRDIFLRMQSKWKVTQPITKIAIKGLKLAVPHNPGVIVNFLKCPLLAPALC